MPQVPTNFSFVPQDPPPTGGKTQPPSALSKFANSLLRAWQLLTTVINGQLSFGNGSSSDNISGVWKTVVFPVANTDVTITHNLGRVPVGYINMTLSQAGSIYTGSVPATTTTITLRSSTGGMTASLFIL